MRMVQKYRQNLLRFAEKCLNGRPESRSILAAVARGVDRTVEGDADMRKSTYYVQGCPTCGRSLEIRVEYLGRTVICQHCRGHFIATDPNTVRASLGEESAIMRRAKELIDQADRQLGMTG